MFLLRHRARRDNSDVFAVPNRLYMVNKDELRNNATIMSLPWESINESSDTHFRSVKKRNINFGQSDFFTCIELLHYNHTN